ncbi:MAG: dihydrolipoyl dehydrogenase [Dehalococcoidia bacterium]
MTEQTFDLAILGGGPGGYVAAIRASQLGMRVALVERERVGGVCLNWGCIPAKALIRGAEVVNQSRDASAFGVEFDALHIALGPNVDRSRGVVDRIVGGVETLLAANGVTVIEGAGRLVGPTRIAVGEDVVVASDVIVATGAHARGLPGVTLDGERVLESHAALARRDLPRSIVIVGGGCVGVEFAYVYRAYGAEVTIVEHQPHLLADMDREVVLVLEESFKRSGIEIVTGARVEHLEVGDGVRATVSVEGGTRDLEAEHALIAIGIEPNSSGIGLEEAGVRLDGHGFVEVDEHGRTSTPHVWAIGDVTGQMALAHVASAQGVLAVETIAGLDVAPLNYDWMPKAVYARPQVAGIGLTEATARERGYEVAVGRFPWRANGKAIVIGETDGLVKLVTDASTGELLGCHMVGGEVTELLGEIGVAHTLESTAAEIAATVHAHPSLAEALKEAALAVTGEAVHFATPRTPRPQASDGPSS